MMLHENGPISLFTVCRGCWSPRGEGFGKVIIKTEILSEEAGRGWTNRETVVMSSSPVGRGGGGVGVYDIPRLPGESQWDRRT